MPDQNHPPQNQPPEIFVAEAEDLPPIEEPRAPGSTLRTATIVSARAIVGIVAIAVAGATIAAAAILPLPSIHSSAPSALVVPVPTAEQLVCPGGLLRLSDAQGTSATKPSALGGADVTSSSTTSGPDVRAFTSSDAATGGGRGAPQLLTAPPAPAGSRESGLIAGAQAESLSTDEFAGLASAACIAGTGDAWLVGGATTVGRTTLLTLANPSAVPATVSLEIFGDVGAVSAPGMDGIVVPGGGQRVISLAGFAPDLASPVVHVTSRGGQIVANLQQSTVRGLEPGGLDFVGEETTAERTTIIPGVVIADSKGVQSRLGESGFDDLGLIMRVYVPGTKDTTAHISVLPEAGSATGNAFTVDVDAGKVTDLPLDDAAADGTALADGSYTIVVTTRVPVVAGVRVSTVGSAAVKAKSDFAWMGAAPQLSSSALLAVPNQVSKQSKSVLHLQNPTKSAEHLTLHPTDGGSDRHVTVPPGSATSVAVASDTSYRLSGFRALYAAVTTVGDGAITGFVVSPPQESSSPLRVFG
jgi:hypothetical protein